ncbi:MAG: O-antigen ligase family protein [Ruminococcus sp.]|nr:O-antigen ligase family protein [Ruminococcus sp.]
MRTLLNLKFDLRQTFVNICLLILLFYPYTRMSFGELIPFKFFLITCTVSLLVVVLLISYKNFKMDMADINVLFMLIIMYLWNNWDFKYGVYYSLFGHAIWFVFYIFASKNPRWIKIAVKFSIFVGLFYSFWTILTWLNSDVYFNFVLPIVDRMSVYSLANQYNQGYMAGLTSHYSTNGLYLSMGVCFTLGYYFFEDKKLNKVSLKGWVILLIQLFSIFLTGKRGPIIFIILAFFVTYSICNSDAPITKYVKVFLIAFAGVIAFIILSYFIPPLMNFIVRFEEQISNNDISSSRFDLWRDAWNGFVNKPLLGNGWYWYKYNNFKNSTIYHPHNVYIQWLCEVGIVGSIALFTFNISMYIKAFKMLKMSTFGKIVTDNREKKLLAISVLYQTFFICMNFTGTAFCELQSICPYILCCAFTQLLWKKYVHGKNNLNRG